MSRVIGPLPGHRRDHRDLERGRVVERRQQPGDRPRQQRLARSRRPHEHDAVSAGQRDLEAASCLELAADLRQVGDGPRHRDRLGRAAVDGTLAAQLDPRPAHRDAPRSPAAHPLHHVADRLDRCQLDPLDQPRLGRGGGRHHDPPVAPPREGVDHRQDPGHRADLAAERELADHRPADAVGPDLLRAEQDPQRDREIERGARLAQLGRREVDGDAARRVLEAGVAQRAADPFAGLLERRVGKADDREAGQAGSDVDLDADHAAGEADERGGGNGREHARTLPGGAYLPLIRRRGVRDQRGAGACWPRGAGRPAPPPRPACRPLARTATATRRAPSPTS